MNSTRFRIPNLLPRQLSWRRAPNLAASVPRHPKTNPAEIPATMHTRSPQQPREYKPVPKLGTKSVPRNWDAFRTQNMFRYCGDDFRPRNEGRNPSPLWGRLRTHWQRNARILKRNPTQSGDGIRPQPGDGIRPQSEYTIRPHLH